MALISAVCAAYAFASAASSWLPFFPIKAWIFFLSDQVPISTKRSLRVSQTNSPIFIIFFIGCGQVIAYLMVTSGAAVMEIIYLGYRGDREVTWSEGCSSFGKFCSRMGIGLLLHFLALCCFLSLSVISAFRTFSRLNPPCVSGSSKEGEERTDN